MVTKMDKISGYLLTTHIPIDIAKVRVRLDVLLGDSQSLSKIFGAEDIFGGSEVGGSLVSGRPLALGSLEEHALPQVG
jgi:hypothetical protein